MNSTVSFNQLFKADQERFRGHCVCRLKKEWLVQCAAETGEQSHGKIDHHTEFPRQVAESTLDRLLSEPRFLCANQTKCCHKAGE
ncbi:hypothetical protein BLNAU_16917 [Blattamonas nauphoetae]|uniref:Uncharacterized protein n=1 Tax=Blattamonas nauphoetae TaxID=2049346 RepID=A0ABQ9XBT1_9EUKA|nr:hypothetical protein BLNAU_16917 [Blattamonas nauphoetae]